MARKRRRLVIKSEQAYDVALRRIGFLMGAKEGSPEAEELERLAIAVENYENKHYPIPTPVLWKIKGSLMTRYMRARRFLAGRKKEASGG